MSQQRIDESEFEQTYRPLRAPNGSWRDFNWTVPSDLEAITQVEREGRLWTRMDEDGFLFTGSGYHYVNRLGYVITEVPVPDDVSIDVYDEEDLQEWEERTLEDKLRRNSDENDGASHREPHGGTGGEVRH
jgi:hypothetical protein